MLAAHWRAGIFCKELTPTPVVLVPECLDEQRRDACAVGGFDVLLRPLLRWVQIGRDIGQCGAEIAAVGRGELPQVHPDMLAEARQHYERLQIEERIVERLGALKLERLTTIGLDLARDALQGSRRENLFRVVGAAKCAGVLST